MITEPEPNENPKSCSTNSSSNIGDNFTFCPFSEAAIRGFVYIREGLNSVLLGIKYFRTVSHKIFKLN
jgi:hypothetical protein